MKIIAPFEIKHRTPHWKFTFPDYEAETTQWYLDNIQDDWVCLDGGANVGYFTVLFSRLAPKGRVFAIEPTDLSDMCRANCVLNHCDNVEHLQVALGERTGLIYECIHRVWGQPMVEGNFPFVTLDDLCQQLPLDRLDLLKLDIDSYEYEALAGATMMLKRFNPVVIVELNQALLERNRKPEDVVALMNNYGYQRLGCFNENHLFKQQ